jgi:hypothetical protein
MLDAVAWLSSLPAAWMVTYLLHSTLVLGGVWLLTGSGLVRDPRARDVLWKVALLGGVVSATVGVIRPAPQPALPEPAQLLADAMPAGERALFIRDEGDVVHVQARVLRRPPLGLGALGAVWILGALLATAAGSRGRRLLHAGVGSLAPADARARAALFRVAGPRAAAWKVGVSAHADSPCVLGTTIVLPVRCAMELGEGELEAVLAHEAGHLVRRDAVWLQAFDALIRALWIQPLNRVARRGFLDASELACDDWAVERIARPEDLARSISRVAEWSRPRVRPGPATALARSRAGLSSRVRRILAGERAAKRGRLVGLALAVVVLWSALALPTVRFGGALEAVILRREGASWVDAGSGAGTRLFRVQVQRVRAR